MNTFWAWLFPLVRLLGGAFLDDFQRSFLSDQEPGASPRCRDDA